AHQRHPELVIGVGHVDLRSNGYARRIRTLIEEGALGTLASVEVTVAHSGGLRMQPGDWRADPAANPGGMLFQCGVHKIHEMMYYFGRVSRVFASMRYDVHGTGTADTAHCQLWFENGLSGTLNAYHVTPYRQAISIYGTDATLYLEHRFFDEGSTLYRQNTQNNEKEPRELVEPDASSDTTGNLRSFYHAIRSGEPCYPSLIDAVNVVDVVFAAERSARTGTIVDIEPKHPNDLSRSSALDACRTMQE
ncbi:MAG: Gfo/Idh/MocA family protein, partial [Phycisphaeraceae bacterium]